MNFFHILADLFEGYYTSDCMMPEVDAVEYGFCLDQMIVCCEFYNCVEEKR